MTNNAEIWKGIPSFERAYECSNYGVVRSLDRMWLRKDGKPYRRKGKILKPYTDVYGYLEIKLTCDGIKDRWKIHRLVAFLFVEGWDAEKEVNHLDFNRINNKWTNLNYLTKPENVKYSKDAGRMKGGLKSLRIIWVKNKKPVSQYDKSGNLLGEWDSYRAAGAATGIPEKAISGVCVGRRKTAGGFIWKPKNIA